MTFLNSRQFFWFLLALPSVFMIHGYLSAELYYGELMHASGELSVRLLILTMAVTPLRLLFPTVAWIVWLQRRRRYLGVATFGYALLHTLFYADKIGRLPELLAEAVAFEYWTGWLGLLLFAALTATSNERSVKLLRFAWKKLHRWVYAAAILSFLHWLLVAFDVVPGLIHALVLGLLETIRIWKSRRSAPA